MTIMAQPGEGIIRSPAARRSSRYPACG